MANEWFRLWHDMPNDPKWRTIARASGQPIALVLSVALHVMTDASRNVTRGHVDVTAEDVASALDVTEADVQAILDAMQGRVLDGERLTGWEKRQPKKEDVGNPETRAKSAAERKRDQRERERQAAAEDVSRTSHDESRGVTTDKEEDKDKEEKQTPPNPRKRGQGFDASTIELPDWLDREDWESWVADRRARKKPVTEEGAKRQLQQLARYLAEGHQPRAVIAHSIAGSYQGLFPPRTTNRTTLNGASAHGNFAQQDYHAGVAADGTF
ncbi:hypothetical protein [Achromobacter sp. 2789STDY5608628]|uniref:hypothetical protein n=1 Tax=Achromobacter sp. 2789STDY5608628 TaxID=1806493 RepID=UPI0006C34A3E|nr:hypothetical protein [Achromobacter sp. 2789STDY5608628]CUJ80710.1 Uncharacterised protein [Achromobacter sp. 2789STDY5608628]